MAPTLELGTLGFETCFPNFTKSRGTVLQKKTRDKAKRKPEGRSLF